MYVGVLVVVPEGFFEIGHSCRAPGATAFVHQGRQQVIVSYRIVLAILQTLLGEADDLFKLLFPKQLLQADIRLSLSVHNQ